MEIVDLCNFTPFRYYFKNRGRGYNTILYELVVLMEIYLMEEGRVMEDGWCIGNKIE